MSLTGASVRVRTGADSQTTPGHLVHSIIFLGIVSNNVYSLLHFNHSFVSVSLSLSYCFSLKKRLRIFLFKTLMFLQVSPEKREVITMGGSRSTAKPLSNRT